MAPDHRPALEQLLDASPLPLFVGTVDGIVAACNAPALQLLRAPAAWVIGSPLTRFDVGRAAGRVEEMHRLLLPGGAARSTTVFRRADGTHISVEVHLSPCLWRDALHVLGVAVPIAEATAGTAAIDAFSARGGLALRCAWCGRTYEHPGRWSEVPAPPASRIPVSHGICPACSAGMDLPRAADGSHPEGDLL